MRRMPGWIFFAIVVGIVFAFAPIGCVEVENGERPPESVAGNAPETTGQEPVSATGAVLMLGRSVMQGWFVSWGWDGQSTVTFHGFEMSYGELASPPEIGADAAAKIAQRPEGSIVFFKLCFVDFWAASSADVDANVEECLGYAREAAEAADEARVRLVIGNALPKVRSETTPALVEAHLRYNEGLQTLAGEHDDVVVFDQYSLLASADGSLAPGLAVAADDSHLNPVAYGLLDEALLETLGSMR